MKAEGLTYEDAARILPISKTMLYGICHGGDVSVNVGRQLAAWALEREPEPPQRP